MGLADKEEALETICLDFSTALDSIPLDTLMSKLGNLGLMKTKNGQKTSYRCSNQQFVVKQESILSRILDESVLDSLLHIFSISVVGWSKYNIHSQTKRLHIMDLVDRIQSGLKKKIKNQFW